MKKQDKAKNKVKPKVKAKPTSKNKPRISRKIGLAIGGAAAVLVLILGFWGYTFAYKSRMLPNVTVGGINIGGLSEDQALQKVEDASKDPLEGKVTLHIDEKNFEEQAQTLGLDYDLRKTVSLAMAYGHGASSWRNGWQDLRALFGKVHFEPILAGDTTKVSNWIDTIALEVDDPVQNANLEVRDDTAYVLEPKDGQEINREETTNRIQDSFKHFLSPDLTVERVHTYPEITRESAEALADKAKELVSKPLVLQIEKRKFTIYQSQLGKWIELKVDKNKDIVVSFAADKIRSYLDSDIAPVVGITPRDAKFYFSGGKISVIQASAEGKTLNSEEVANGIVALLEDGTRDRELQITLESQEAKINEELVNNVSKYGIKELVGTATTNFSGSPSNRVHNIKTGAQFLNGLIIAPGEEFSTIKHLGSIDGASGYLQELVIKEDRTVPEFGGGLCQVSTTLFRAAMNAGLKITERHNHSYRVSYYEPPVGMDATIYSPRPDLRFVNNTDHYILVQSSVSGYNITFNFYGTSDGRRVEISNPEVYDITQPGDTIYVEDPSMEPGTERYLEHAHAGAKAIFYYKVYNKDGSVKIEQTFRSSYVAWPARIVRGPEKAPEEANQDQ